MTLILCLDDHNGMMFNNRRQSADRVVDQRILDLSADGRLFVDTYSKKKFSNAIEICEGCSFYKADVCFAETADAVTACIPHTDRIIIYRWNRIYPADAYLTADLTGWNKIETTEFAGYSHENITQEVYIREK